MSIVWGYVGPWYGELLTMDENPVLAKAKFLHKYGLTHMSIGLDEVAAMTDQERFQLAEALAKYELLCSPFVGYPYVDAAPEEIERNTAGIAADLWAYRNIFSGGIVMTSSGSGHRFDRNPPVEEKLSRLNRALEPLALACRQLGTPLGIENHGDFYCSDLVKLCRETKDLYIFLDTGNTYLIGEQPLPAFQQAAPYAIGTHFKDHKVSPQLEARPLHFEVANSVIGDGDVPLRECYQLLIEQAPYPDKLVMEIEMICPVGMNPLAAFEQSLQFVRGLEPAHKRG